MNKKTAVSLGRIILVSFVMLFSVAAISSAATDIVWDNGDGDQDWTNPLNWIGHVVPGTASTQYARIRMTAGPVFSGQTATTGRVYLESAGNGTLTMNSGSLTTVSHIYAAATSSDTATINMSGGEINIGGTFYVARDSGSNATVNISGGDISCNLLSINRNSGAVGTIDLSGGTITCNTLTIYTNANGGTVINITSTGALIIDNAGAAEVSTYIAGGWIKAYEGNGVLLVDTTTIPGKTILQADLPVKARSPSPNNGATYEPIDRILSWTAGFGAVSHDIYFGTDAAGVAAAQRLAGDLDASGQVDYKDLLILINYWLIDFDFSDYALLAQDWQASSSPYFKGNTIATNYDDPCDFQMNTTYYWRIDEVNGPNTVKGDLWSFTTTDNSYSLNGKIMCGYQGWFNTPTDGAGRGWVHWGNSSFSPTSCNVDFWPDMTEYGVDEKFLAPNFYDGVNHYVFSPYKRDTVVRHFQWMQDYGIDGVYLQRFATETTPGSAAFNHRNMVLSHCKEGANLYGRKYAVMYDLSGLSSGGTQKVIDDWKFLVDTMNVTRDPNDHGYMFHNGKPVVSLWGFGFGRAYEGGDESYNLMNFFKNDPVYGGCTIMLGVNNDWQTSIEMRTLLLVDIISPWTVGRYNYSGSVSWITSHAVAEKAWCDANGKEFLPVIWPGFSWYNMHSGSTLINEHPRYGGQFLWAQLRANVSIAGANMIYVAMFDEVDEGTAIFKVTNNPPVVLPAQFVTYRQDLPSPDGGPGILPAGAELPSDEYLWLVGQACRALRGEILLTPTRPVRP